MAADLHHSHVEMEFYCAATAGNLAAVDRLLAQGDDQIVVTQAFAGHSILHGACNIHRPGVVEALLARPRIRNRLLNLPDQRHARTPLQTCITAKHDDLALLLLKQDDIQVHHLDDEGRTALHLACYCNSSPVVIQALIRKMNEKDTTSMLVHKRDKFGKTPLLYAADHANVVIVQQLLAMPSDPSKTSTCWEWELSHTVRGQLQVPQYQAVARLLLDAGMLIQATLTSKHPYKIHVELLQWLQHQQADVGQQVRAAASRGDIPHLEALLLLAATTGGQQQQQSDASLVVLVNQPSQAPLRYTALHCAARYGSPAAVSLLLDAGASPWKDKYEDDETTTTPLQLAASYGHLHIIEELLRGTLVMSARS